jgi:uncharacterized protein (TIGR02453 family)
LANGSHFSPKLFAFLRELERNNDREWFQANKKRYESDVKDPLLHFIAEVAGPLARISPHFRADSRPVGGSLFRVYRDVRFSKDKRPYKTHAAAHFRHERAKDVHAPGFYLHLEPRQIFLGTGIWRPDSKALGRIRDRIVDDPGLWKRILGAAKFRADFRLEGESLKRPPRGYDAEHPLVEDLKRKDFISVAAFTQEEACSADFLGHFAGRCKVARAFVRFLTEALELDF